MIRTEFATKALLVAALGPMTVACQMKSGEGGVAGRLKDDHGQTHDAPSTHGMLMVGDGPVYLSHLPMFHRPHDYQLLLQVELVKSGSDPTATYANDRRVTGEKVYTVVPELFALPELFTPSTADPERKTFKATIVRGHFERGGSPIMEDVTVNVARVIYVKKFAAQPAPLPNLRYAIFGNEAELFAAHIVNKKPDFDHVVAVRITTGVQTPEQAAAIRTGALIDFTQTANEVGNALLEGTSATGSVELAGQRIDVGIEVPTDYYLETGDLAF